MRIFIVALLIAGSASADVVQHFRGTVSFPSLNLKLNRELTTSDILVKFSDTNGEHFRIGTDANGNDWILGQSYDEVTYAGKHAVTLATWENSGANSTKLILRPTDAYLYFDGDTTPYLRIDNANGILTTATLSPGADEKIALGGFLGYRFNGIWSKSLQSGSASTIINNTHATQILSLRSSDVERAAIKTFGSGWSLQFPTDSAAYVLHASNLIIGLTALGNYFNISAAGTTTPGTFAAGGGSANKAVCWKNDGVTLGYCSTTPTNGTCTCN